ncbi:hypothetical protein MTR_2g036820 [Medicago truncatula]|uniref:Uncharacterized protein n=1 Tax=Medicago truncatula TaxID=3880 RepID=G7IN19_MEDTR|nr:hypothetical protein MTR_2g036820 [Medicago truncatula]
MFITSATIMLKFVLLYMTTMLLKTLSSTEVIEQTSCSMLCPRQTSVNKYREISPCQIGCQIQCTLYDFSLLFTCQSSNVVGASTTVPVESIPLISMECFQHGEVQDYLDIGDMDSVCRRCNAQVWLGECSQRRHSTPTIDASICCMKGKITLPNMIEPPPLLRGLFNGVDPRSAHFIGPDSPHFVISGQNYHRIGSLLLADGQAPKFCQLYTYDTENELVNRLSHFSGHAMLVNDYDL